MRLAAIILLLCSTTAEVRRQDFQVPGDPGISLFVRHVASKRATGVPVLLLHGARVPGVASFDLPVAGGSLAADLAAAGHDVYLMDARGYGGSTRMSAMEGTPGIGPALARSSDVVRDLAAVVEWMRARHHGAKPAILGWATGGHWVGHYASIYSDRLSGVILLNSLYGGTAGHPTLGGGSDLEDPTKPGTFNAAAFGAYRLSAASSLLAPWDRSIPVSDKAAWRDPAVAAAYVSAAIASDPTSLTRTPPSFRAPSGAMEDSFYLATGRQLWDASLIGCPILAIRSERDFWSRPEDLATLERHALRAPVRIVTIAGATHFVHLDRPERGRAQLLEEVLGFLAQRTAAPSK